MELKNLLSIKEFDFKNKIKSDKKISKDFLNEVKKIAIEKVEKGQTVSNPKREISNGFKVEKIEKVNQDGKEYIVLSGKKKGVLKRLVGKEVNVFESKKEVKEDIKVDAETGNLFGYAQVKDQTIKKVGSFTSFTKMINPPTPKERPVLNAGQFIDNDKVQGYINRIEGNKVFVESLENPGEIIEVSIKDAIKIKKEKKEHTAIKKIEESKYKWSDEDLKSLKLK